jgi:hypothetical protein
MNVATMGTQTIDFGSSNTLVFRANTSTERMRISNTGNIGIGTASPVRPLHIAGSGTVARFESLSTTNATVAEFLLPPAFTAGQFARFAWRANTATTVFSGIETYFQNLTTGSESGDIAFSTVNGGAGLTEKFRIAANGQVSVTSSGSASAPIISKSDDLNTGIFFPAADTIAFSEGGVESMRIDSSGNLGIGLTNPDSKLHISSTGVGAVRFLYNGLSENYFDADLNIFRNKSNTERMRIDSSGNMLIGSTSIGSAATTNLTIGTPGSVSGGITLWAGTTSSHGINFGDGTSGADQYRGSVEYAHNGNSMRFYTDGSERMRIMSDGCLNIGKTDNATGRLDIGGQANGVATNVARFGNIVGLNNGPIISVDASNNWLINQASGSIRVGSSIAVGGATALYGVGGITFPATQSASADANTLDDYEEGTWTPTQANFTVSGTSTLTGTYTKIGRVVYFNLSFANTGTIAFGVSCLITLPFTGIDNSGMVAMSLLGNSESMTSGKNGVQVVLDTVNSRFFVGNFTTTSSGQTLLFGGFYRVS